MAYVPVTCAWYDSDGWDMHSTPIYDDTTQPYTLTNSYWCWHELAEYSDRPPVPSGSAVRYLRQLSTTGWGAGSAGVASVVDPGGTNLHAIKFTSTVLTNLSAGEYCICWLYNRSGTHWAYYQRIIIQDPAGGGSGRVISLYTYDTPEAVNVVYETEGGSLIVGQDPA